jgi:prophage tail gpP-like protein
VGPNNYTVTINCRGKLKQLIDNSHDVTTTLLRTTSKTALERLVEPWGFDVDWQAAEDELDKVRCVDGASVFECIDMLSKQCSLFVRETSDGKLLVTDGAQAATGEPLVLGHNIHKFSVTQYEVMEHSAVTVKGQRIDRDQWGAAAVIDRLTEVGNNLASGLRPKTVQHYGNATDELLAKRASYELDQRSAEDRKVTITVFGVLQADGTAWDVGIKHRVKIPCEGIDTDMEVTELTYQLDGKSRFHTQLTLSPPPTTPTGNTGAKGTLSNLESVGLQGSNTGVWATVEAVQAPVVTDKFTSSFGMVQPSDVPLTLPEGFDDV